jgi:hypothetical protein
MSRAIRRREKNRIAVGCLKNFGSVQPEETEGISKIKPTGRGVFVSTM